VAASDDVIQSEPGISATHRQVPLVVAVAAERVVVRLSVAGMSVQSWYVSLSGRCDNRTQDERNEHRGDFASGPIS
jgi:hypothetical protein